MVIVISATIRERRDLASAQAFFMASPTATTAREAELTSAGDRCPANAALRDHRHRPGQKGDVQAGSVAFATSSPSAIAVRPREFAPSLRDSARSVR